MRENPEHQFKAILFADIVGYTSLMQSDEQVALGKLQNFKLQLEIIVPAHNGTIIQFYGDGCLIVFDDSVVALSCAKVLQVAFQTEPNVPVRIGLHAGEVIFKDENVFGHAVNLASRVESLGIAGGILMTKEVWKAVNRFKDFKLNFVGNFQLKNVKETVAIYALANSGFPIPNKVDLERKSNLLPKSRKQHNRLIKLVAALLGLILGFIVWNSLPTTDIDTKILKERIAVLPFKNNTSVSDLDVLGSMAADWINTGLMEIEDAEVVSPFTVRTHNAAIINHITSQLQTQHIKMS